MLVHPEDGAAVSTVTYDTPAAATAWAVARGARPSLGIEVLDTTDFALLVAHLRGTETR